eukprot:12409976-Karenia_brevis.AAC.1
MRTATWTAVFLTGVALAPPALATRCGGGYTAWITSRSRMVLILCCSASSTLTIPRAAPSLI